ncbi:MAG: hypothetical protein R3F48_06580 [Candidatus Zixiibacteriota bacterium]
MKYRFFPLLAVMLLAVISCTEKAPEIPNDLIQPRIDELTAKLNLTEAQIQQIRPIIIEATGKMREMMQNPGEAGPGFGGPRGMRGASDSLRMKVAAILEPDQAALLDSLRLPLTPGMTVIELYDRLKLTPEQVAWVDSVSISFREKMAELRAGQDRDSFDREAMMELREQYNRDIGELFTADQWQAYEQYQSERMSRMQERMQGGGGPGGGMGGQ